jgi:2-aminoethylphosphonate-pyruvate transaminase
VIGNKLLFTPGPLTTGEGVKKAMLRDAGSRDGESIGGAAPGGDYQCVLMQGSGTFAIESVISSVILAGGGLLVLVNADRG